MSNAQSPLGDGFVKIPLQTRRGFLSATVDRDVAERLKAHEWLLHTRGYPYRSDLVNGKRVITSMHRMILGLAEDDKRRVEFLSEDMLDCRRANLKLKQTRLPPSMVQKPIDDEPETEELGIEESETQGIDSTQELKLEPEPEEKPVINVTEELIRAAVAESGDRDIIVIFERAVIKHVSNKKFVVEVGFQGTALLTRTKLIQFMKKVFEYTGNVECILNPSLNRRIEKNMSIVAVSNDEDKQQQSEHTIRSLQDELALTKAQLKSFSTGPFQARALDAEHRKEEERIMVEMPSVPPLERSFTRSTTDQTYEQKVVIEQRQTTRTTTNLRDVPVEDLIRELKSRGASKIIF